MDGRNPVILLHTIVRTLSSLQMKSVSLGNFCNPFHIVLKGRQS
jgi:hypothetical protein